VSRELIGDATPVSVIDRDDLENVGFLAQAESNPQERISVQICRENLLRLNKHLMAGREALPSGGFE
jgi:hypothetical protein